VTVTIYHNPACGTSRNVLGLIRNSGEEPRVIEYLKTPPSRDELVDLIRRMAIRYETCSAGRARRMKSCGWITRGSPMTSCSTP
jgi:arsenate reductase-like glutaredoxin family protein